MSRPSSAASTPAPTECRRHCSREAAGDDDDALWYEAAAAGRSHQRAEPWWPTHPLRRSSPHSPRGRGRGLRRDPRLLRTRRRADAVSKRGRRSPLSRRLWGGHAARSPIIASAGGSRRRSPSRLGDDASQCGTTFHLARCAASAWANAASWRCSASRRCSPSYTRCDTLQLEPDMEQSPRWTGRRRPAGPTASPARPPEAP